MSAAVGATLRIGLAGLTVVAVVAPSRGARAMDCPCTWEDVICRADAVAEIEMVLATKTTPDHMVVRRVIWNRTKHRIRPPYGQPNIPHVTKTRSTLLGFLAAARREQPHAPLPGSLVIYWRAVMRGRYRTIAFLEHSPKLPWVPWSGGGAAYTGAEWLDDPRHAGWWATIEPYLKERIEADKRHETPPFCARVRPESTQIKM